MADVKTKPTAVRVSDFLDAVEPEEKRRDSYAICKIMEEITGEKGKMWGPSIVGFGNYHYAYESGHEGDMCVVGFSPRKPHLVIYLLSGFAEKQDLLEKLGKHKASKGCLYIKRLSDIDTNILKQLIQQSVEYVRKKYPST